VAVRANAPVVAARPNGTGTPFVDELLQEPLAVRQGQLVLGMTVVGRYRMPDPLRLPEGACYEPMSGKTNQVAGYPGLRHRGGAGRATPTTWRFAASTSRRTCRTWNSPRNPVAGRRLAARAARAAGI